MKNKRSERLHVGRRRGQALSAAITLIVLACGIPAALGDEPLPEARPVPDVQVIPLPYDQASFQHRGRELTRYHFGPSLERPFLFPVIGPAGVTYTRIGHPHDPIDHSHHNSVWISHQNVNGVNFWEDESSARIVCRHVARYDDGAARASLLAVNEWRAPEGGILMLEQRGVAVQPLERDEWLMTIDIQLEAPGDTAVSLGETPFGLIGVRVARSMGVRDGGGRILNSQGQRNEEEIFRKPARWVDYSGPVTDTATGGITLMDHPANPNHPAPFHVRGDGWMGACLTLNKALEVAPARPLRLRYGLWVHAGVPGREDVERKWTHFTAAALEEIVPLDRASAATRPR